jgi:hypothetical protein
MIEGYQAEEDQVRKMMAKEQEDMRSLNKTK